MKNYGGPNPFSTPARARAPLAAYTLHAHPPQRVGHRIERPGGFGKAARSAGTGSLARADERLPAGNTLRLQQWEAQDRATGQYNAQAQALALKQEQERQQAGYQYGTLANAYAKTYGDLQGKNLGPGVGG